MWNPGAGRLRVCILIAVCNEEASLPELAVKLRKLHATLQPAYRVEYCFVDDGSTDRTATLVLSTVPTGARVSVLSHGTNRGIGAAFRTGVLHTDADIICTIDADCSYPPTDLDRMITEIAAGQTDIVVASPYHPEGSVLNVQRWRLFLSLQCSLLYRIFTPLKLHTYTSMFRAYRGAVARSVRFPSDGFVSTVEIVLDAASRGARISEAPLVLSRRAKGRSKMRLGQTIRAHLRLIALCCLAKLRGGYPTFERSTLSTSSPVDAQARRFAEPSAPSLQEMPDRARVYSSTVSNG
jgi:dolichol-phosphate mannosyltransferase